MHFRTASPNSHNRRSSRLSQQCLRPFLASGLTLLLALYFKFYGIARSPARSQKNCRIHLSFRSVPSSEIVYCRCSFWYPTISLQLAKSVLHWSFCWIFAYSLKWIKLGVKCILCFLCQWLWWSMLYLQCAIWYPQAYQLFLWFSALTLLRQI